ncbi:MAG: hypothetical protein Q7S61_00130, partial [bacterium]|nr:hypothetical protein [bacterium]
AAATVTTVSLRNLKISERKIIATRYMEDVASWLRAQKESDWNTFAEKASAGGGNTYCFNSTSISWPSASVCGETYALGNTFRREVNLVTDPSNAQVTSTVSVTWQDSIGIGGTMGVLLNTVYSVWEQ